MIVYPKGVLEFNTYFIFLKPPPFQNCIRIDFKKENDTHKKRGQFSWTDENAPPANKGRKVHLKHKI